MIETTVSRSVTASMGMRRSSSGPPVSFAAVPAS